MKIFHTYSIQLVKNKTGNARLHALIQFNLHSFDQHIITYSLVSRIVLIRSRSFFAQFLFHFLHTIHFCGYCRATMTWRCKSVRGEPFDFSRGGGGRLDDLEKIYIAAPRQKKKFHAWQLRGKKIMSAWCGREKNSYKS